MSISNSLIIIFTNENTTHALIVAVSP